MQGSLTNEQYAELLVNRMNCNPRHKRAASREIITFLVGRYMINAIERGKYTISQDPSGSWMFQQLS